MFCLQMGDSESISDNVASRCKEQGIDYYRFSPQLDKVVSVGETDLDDLFEMILAAKKSICDTQSKDVQKRLTCRDTQSGNIQDKDTPAKNFRRLVLRFHQCSIANEKMKVRLRFAPKKT